MTKIDMLVDDVRVLRISKEATVEKRVDKGGMTKTSTNGMMKVQNVHTTGSVITVEVMQWLAGK
jgi:hypothetical protein